MKKLYTLKLVFITTTFFLTTQNSLNAVDCKPLKVTTNSPTVVGYVNCNNMEAPNKTLAAGETLVLQGNNGVRPGTMVRVEHQKPIFKRTVNVAYQPIGEGLTIKCESRNVGTPHVTHECLCNGNPCNHL